MTETESPGMCLSACAFAFLGGKWRMAADRTLGVHQHYPEIAMHEPAAKQFTAGDLSAQQIISGLLAEYIVRMGVDARFLTVASMTEPRGMYLFTADEMYKFGIQLDDLAFSPWSFEPYQSGLVAVSKTPSSDYVATLLCRTDKALKLLVNRPFYKVSADRATFEFTLPQKIVTGTIDNNAGMGAVGSSRQLFYFNIPSKEFPTYVKLIGRNCV